MVSNRADGDTDSNDVSKRSDALTDMSEEQMSQHLALCLKLDAENKINTKNAFGLHLIDIMRHKIKHNVPDLQSASLSLQASSKIYAGRVDALYKDTFAFHNQLQTIRSNKKANEDREQANDDEDMDQEPKERRRTTKSKQSFIASEDSVSFKSESNFQNTIPHANFITIKSAFAASRTAPKLLERLPLENDSCKLFCTVPLPCFNPLAPVSVVDFSFPAKRKGLIQKVQNIRLAESESATFCSDVFFAPSPKSPCVAPEMDAPCDDSFCIGSSPVHEQQQDADVEDIIDKFSVLDITADVLVKDLSLAIVDGNAVDRNRLPPNSALKRVLNTAEKSRLRKTPMTVRKEKPPREPFFNQQRVLNKSILKRGRKMELTDNDISQWKLKDSTERSNGTELFSTLLADNFDNNSTNNNKTILKTMHQLMQENVAQYFDGYSCKELQLWNKYGKQRNAQLIRPSSFGICLNNHDSNEISTENSNHVVQSFQNLSLENSPTRSDDYDAGVDDIAPPDFDSLGDSFTIEPPMPNRLSRSGLYEDDLKSVMVTPPEMAQRITMKFETKPITLSTERVKNAIWNIVEKGDVLLSEMYKELQNVFEREYLPLQYAFTTLLIMANEKCLLLENISEGDIKIMKDILE